MKNNKEQQIEEMMLDVPQTIVAYDANPKGQHLYGEQRRQIAEALYNTGYRKLPEGAVVLTKEECEHKVILDEDHFERALNYEREKVRKETAKEILTYLWKQRNVIGQLMIFEEDIIKLAKQYGVEVEE